MSNLIPIKLAEQAIANLETEVERLKAENERLTSENLLVREEADLYCRLWQKANNEVYGQRSQIAALIDELERIRKEGKQS